MPFSVCISPPVYFVRAGPEVTADVTVFNSSTQGLNVAAVLKHPDHSHWTNEPVTLLPIGKTAVFEVC